jgi:SAM-dependent methyltransferase
MDTRPVSIAPPNTYRKIGRNMAPDTVLTTSSWGENEPMRRERRLVFGEAADLYDRARPTYPAPLLDDLVTLVGPHARVLDVGCGTGKATRLLAERGATGVGVEAHPAMAEVARRSLAGRPGWRIDVSGFEDWQPAGGDAPFDLVTCAQAWHWLDPDVRMHKAHGLLRSGGWLALFWNTHPDDQPGPAGVQEALAEVYARLAPDLDGLPQPVTAAHSRPLPPDLPFDPPIARSYSWTQDYTTATWLDLLRTHSNHRMLAEAERERLLAAVAEVIDAHGGGVTNRYLTQLWAARRSRDGRPQGTAGGR